MKNNDELFDQISEYYSGEENQEIIKEELNRDPEAKALLLWIDQFWNRLNPKGWNPEKIHKRTRQKIALTQRPVPSFLQRAVKYAAAIFLTLGLGGAIYYYHSSKNVPWLTVTSGTGEIKEVALPDGSKAWLNAQSTLRYPGKFEGNLRKVTMGGEVYFSVKRDTECPFIVQADNIQVNVLGTEFLVSNYGNEPVTNTYLMKGSIELELNGLETMRLVPGDQVTYDKKNHGVTKVNDPHVALDAWRFGKLSFYNESLFEIARKLERKFGKEIQIQDEHLGNMKYTADFEAENLEQILEFFNEGSHIGYINIENGYRLTKK